MVRVEKQKDGDCFICAYASCEGISWKASLRRIRKRRFNTKKFGSVSLELVMKKGLKGYSFAKDGDYKSLAEIFKYKSGVLFVNWGDNNGGHAVAFDGIKLICHKSTGFLDGMNSENFKLPKGASVAGAMIKDDYSNFLVLRNYIINTIVRLGHIFKT